MPLPLQLTTPPPDLPTLLVLADIHVVTFPSPLILYECVGAVPELLEGQPVLNALGRPTYRVPRQSWRYQRSVDDPALVVALMTEATMRVLQGAGAIDVYTAQEQTAMHLEERLRAGEALPVRTTIITGAALMDAAGIPD